MAAPLSIGALAEQSGCNVPTIRYYEQIGLLPRALRTAGGHRHYRDSDLRRLQFIRRCRDFGFPIEQVRAMLAMVEDGDGDCVEVRELAQAQLSAVRARLAELHGLEASLAAFVADCDRSCLGGAKRDCCIIESISACGTPAEAIDIAATEIRRRS